MVEKSSDISLDGGKWFRVYDPEGVFIGVYAYDSKRDQFRPEKKVDPHTIYEENVYARHVADAINATGKFGYYNSWFLKRVRDARAK